MKICVYGAGAIGGYLAVELAASGQDVCVIARGAHLLAIQENGLKLVIHGREKVARIAAGEDPRAFGVQDLVICALKAHQAYDCAASFAPLLGPETAFLTAMNGIPWWYFYRSGGRFEGHHLGSVDPGGRQWHSIQPERAIGCVVEPACEVSAPGVIVHHDLNRFIIGEPDGSRSSRVLELSEVLTQAGFDAPVRDNIRWNIWLKLWGNVCFNPISVLTQATLDRIIGEPQLRALCQTMMLETKAVNEALGVQIPADMLERRLAAAGALTGHKMSMLQDLERGRRLEIDALVTAVQELGRLTAVSTPIIDAVLALVQARAKGLGLYAPLGTSR
ncbi:MAG TPA: 2-dehydropantoate 2-reductase [Steroidobacteraceae bacterium]|jgi:2-dehydropantoate 2-reductase|nr:2-dehydropantoate 2-reductase [Steroidobacteraceae bacterium]